MSTSDVPPDEMGNSPNATDDALERTLSGQEPATDEWRELDGFVQDLREAVPARPRLPRILTWPRWSKPPPPVQPIKATRS